MLILKWSLGGDEEASLIDKYHERRLWQVTSACNDPAERMLQNGRAHEDIAGVQAVNGSRETNICANASQFARISLQIDFILIKIFADRSAARRSGNRWRIYKQIGSRVWRMRWERKTGY